MYDDERVPNMTFGVVHHRCERHSVLHSQKLSVSDNYCARRSMLFCSCRAIAVPGAKSPSNAIERHRTPSNAIERQRRGNAEPSTAFGVYARVHGLGELRGLFDFVHHYAYCRGIHGRSCPGVSCLLDQINRQVARRAVNCG